LALQNALNGFIPLAVIGSAAGGSNAGNNATARSTGGNRNATAQAAGQQQSGTGTGCISAPGSQSVGQLAGNAQTANSGAASLAGGVSNVTIPVRILSPGGGAVSQANTVSAESLAENVNETIQAAGQTQSAANTGTQAIGQAAQNAQHADSAAIAAQGELDGAGNLAVPVAVLSPGDAGDVAQGNDAAASSGAGNVNSLIQAGGQTQGG
jgi:hypothetical protein